MGRGAAVLQVLGGQPVLNEVTNELSRRALLAGAVASIGLAAACSSSSLPDGVPDVDTGKMVTGSFRSRLRGGAQTGWAVSYPPGRHRSPLPALVTLHGRGGDHTTAFGRSLHLDRYLAQAVRQGVRPFAIASVDGGDHDYWHPRRSGRDPAAMVVHEFLPLLARQGLDVSRIGLLGWSMGGYGVLYVSTLLRARRVAVTVAESPAIWHHGYQTVAGAFDDAADFDAHCIWGRQRLLAGIALRIDCGASDGFAPVTRDLRASISPTPAGGIEAGEHDSAYWRSVAPAQLAFVGRHLSR